MAAKAAPKPTGKTKTELTKEKTKLNKDIKSKKAELEVLSAKIKDLETLSSKREQLQIEVDELTKAKREVGKLTVSQQSIEKEIKVLSDEKKQLSSFIKKNTPRKDQLTKELEELSKNKSTLDDEVTKLTERSNKAEANVDHLKKEKEKYEREITTLKTEYDLYPRDLKHLTKDAKDQMKKYSSLALVTGVLSLVFVIALVFLLLSPNPLNGQLSESIGDDLSLRFWTIIVTKVLLAITLLFIVRSGFGLLSGFFNQYITVRKKITALRAADLFVRYMDEEDLNGESGLRRNPKELKYLQDYLPRIMDLDTSFDHLTRKSRKKDLVS